MRRRDFRDFRTARQPSGQRRQVVTNSGSYSNATRVLPSPHKSSLRQMLVADGLGYPGVSKHAGIPAGFGRRLLSFIVVILYL